MFLAYNGIRALNLWASSSSMGDLMSSNQSKGDKRAFDILANVAVAVTLILSAVLAVVALPSRQNDASIAGIYSIGTVGSLVIIAAILVCYSVVVLRAPSGGRWAFVAILAACFGIG